MPHFDTQETVESSREDAEEPESTSGESHKTKTGELFSSKMKRMAGQGFKVRTITIITYLTSTASHLSIRFAPFRDSREMAPLAQNPSPR